MYLRTVTQDFSACFMHLCVCYTVLLGSWTNGKPHGYSGHNGYQGDGTGLALNSALLEPQRDHITEYRHIDADAYLKKYGYLAHIPRHIATRSTDLTHTQHSKQSAVRLFQKFAHLPETGVLDEATIEKMGQPRCGYKDVMDTPQDPNKPFQYIAASKWLKNTVTWNVDQFTSKVNSEDQRKAFENSFRRWEAASNLDLVRTNGRADITIGFETGSHGDGDDFDGQGNVLAHAFAPGDGRVHLDNDENWVYHSNDGAEIETVTTHELGHALGLSHSPVYGSVMSPFYIQYQANFPLHSDDIAGMQYLYGRPPTTATPQQMNVTTGPPTANITIDTDLCNSRIQAATTDDAGDLVLFIGRQVYKLYGSCNGGIASCLLPGYPRGIRKVYKHGPNRVTAAVHVPDQRKLTYLFKGRKVWRFTNGRLDIGFPKQMSKEALPFKPSASYLHKNQYHDYQWYMFSGRYFWELNLRAETISNNVMKTRTYWDHMPSKPDAMVQLKDGSIYVFKGKYYNRYDHQRTLQERRRPIALDFIGTECQHLMS